jgi:hypothetical protein
MAQLYVPDQAYLICSDGMKTQQIKVNSQSTIKIAKGRLAATIKDRTGANFVCAKMVIAGAIIGVIVAGIVAAAIALSGGTLAIGLGAALAAGAVGGAAVGLQTAMMPCICAILTMPKDWQPVHPKVLVEGKKALIEKSIVPCVLGGSVQIMYSKEAAEAAASLNRSKTFATVAGLATLVFVGGSAAAALVGGVTSIGTAFITFGMRAGFVQIAGMAGVGGASYGINAGYDFLKEWSGADPYIKGDAYANHDPNHEKLDDYVDGATDKSLGAKIDALDSGQEIRERQTVALNTTTQTTQTIATNNSYVVSSNGTVVPPGTVTATQTTVVSSNQIPFASPSRVPSNISSVQNEPIIIRSTPNTLEMSRSSSITQLSSQYNNRGIFASGLKTFGGGVVKGMGINILIDAARALGNWAISSDLKRVEESLKAELAARESITVIEDEV